MRTRSLAPRSALLALALSAAAPILPARIISYAPVTNRHANPAVQHRENRHYVLVESASPIFSGWAHGAKLVVYDSKGETEPRVVFPKTDSAVTILAAACREEAGQPLRILVFSDADLNGENPQRAFRFLYSVDAGESWKAVALPEGSWLANDYYFRPDVGGPIVRERDSQVRIGSPESPFVVAVVTYSGKTSGIYAIGSGGSPRLLLDTSSAPHARLIGSDREGKRFLVHGAFLDPASQTPDSVRIVDLERGLIRIFPFADPSFTVEGWITPGGAVYLEDLGRFVWIYQGGVLRQVVAAPQSDSVAPPYYYYPPLLTLFAVPTADFSGAWIIQRDTGKPTILTRHAPGSPLVEQWRDVSGPEVEALHAAASGNKVLVQVHVPRPQADQRIFRDPALAIWEVGKPAPRRYDELFLVEGFQKGFVHLDVDAVAGGEPFVFDSSATVTYTVLPSAGGGGGGDVTQEWGVVRASLKQRLVIPAVGRLPGAFGSFWRTDLIVRNPSAERISVLARYVPSAAGNSGAQPLERRIQLGPSEIWLYPDVLGAIFDVARGSGALFLTPDGDAAVTATSRTYTDSPKGTYGMGIGAVDLFAASGPRFPVSFAGALQGADFRTNVVTVDTSGRGSEVSLRAVERGRSDFSFPTPAGGQAQLNGLGVLLDVPVEQSGALQVEPLSGQVIASAIAVDNRTNDPTWFPPDLPSPFVRTIPVIGHVDGAGGSRFRSDLFLFNPSDESRSITLTAKRWDVGENEKIVNVTLRGRESRTIRDVLLTLFGKTGIARLRFVSGNEFFDPTGIRVTSRLYTIDASGGTYGLLVPPLNSFQSAGPGESLEILGPQGGKNFRTNLSLVELTAFPEGPPARVRIEIFDDYGALVDSFETSVPIAGGIQLLDVFRARGLGNGPPAALIRVSPLGGLVGAFATTLDNGTNDPTYFGAVLASRD